MKIRYIQVWINLKLYLRRVIYGESWSIHTFSIILLRDANPLPPSKKIEKYRDLDVGTFPLEHDEVSKHFPRYWPLVRWIHRSPVNFPHKGQWRGAFMFSLIFACINGRVNNGEAGDLRRHRAQYDVILMTWQDIQRSPLFIAMVNGPFFRFDDDDNMPFLIVLCIISNL